MYVELYASCVYVFWGHSWCAEVLNLFYFFIEFSNEFLCVGVSVFMCFWISSSSSSLTIWKIKIFIFQIIYCVKFHFDHKFFFAALNYKKNFDKNYFCTAHVVIFSIAMTFLAELEQVCCVKKKFIIIEMKFDNFKFYFVTSFYIGSIRW